MHFERDRSADNVGFDTNGVGVAGGVQTWTDGGWLLGAAAGYEHGSLDTYSTASSDANLFHLGVSIGHALGPAELSGSIAAGYGRYDVERIVPVGGDATVDGAHDLITVGGRVGAGWRVGDQRGYVLPRLDLSAIHQMMPGFDEKGGNGYGLQVDGNNQTYVALQPALELGAAVEPREGLHVRPHLTVGVTQFLTGAAPSATAAFAGDPGGVPPFQARTTLDATLYHVTAGVDVQSDAGISLLTQGSFGTSAHTRGYGGSMMVRIPF